MTTPKLAERDISKQVIDLARYAGFQALRLHSGVLRGKHRSFVTLNATGTPDWVLIRPIESGRADVVFLELKRPKGKASAVQVAMHEEYRERGYLVAVIDSVEAFREFLQVTFAYHVVRDSAAARAKAKENA